MFSSFEVVSSFESVPLFVDASSFVTVSSFAVVSSFVTVSSVVAASSFFFSVSVEMKFYLVKIIVISKYTHAHFLSMDRMCIYSKFLVSDWMCCIGLSLLFTCPFRVDLCSSLRLCT